MVFYVKGAQLRICEYRPKPAVLYRDLLRLYAGPRPRLGHDITWLILEIAGMCGRGNKTTFYWIYN